MEFSRPEYWSGWLFPSPGDLPSPGIEPRSPTLQADSLPIEPQGKPKNTGVSSLSLLQGIFPTQELNQGLLRCRWILYQLSYQESMIISLYPKVPLVVSWERYKLQFFFNLVYFLSFLIGSLGFPGGSDGKESGGPQSGRPGFPGLERSSAGGYGNLP